MMPAWRSESELTYMTPNTDGKLGPHQREIVLRKLNSDQDPVVLSASWPKEATGDWLGEHDDENDNAEAAEPEGESDAAHD